MESSREKREEWAGDSTMLDDADEMRHLYAVLDSFRQYRRRAHFHTTHTRRQALYALPQAHWERLAAPPVSFLDTLSAVDDAIDVNAELAERIALSGAASMGVVDEGDEGDKGDDDDDDPHDVGIGSDQQQAAGGGGGWEQQKQPKQPPWANTATRLDLDKARSTLHQLYRDWSSAGACERRACYEPVLAALAAEFPAHAEQQQQRILVPGAGLGRLVYELAKAGYHAEGNEISYHQLLASSFVLNHTARAEEWPLHPFVMSFANVASREDQLARVLIPDEHPGSLGQGGGSMSMTTGDFVRNYCGEEEHSSGGNGGAFDAVATVFFIDTARNLTRYIETVRHCLRPGGLWINLGPLLWHFAGSDDGKAAAGDADADVEEHGGFELCDDEVVALVQQFGFVIEKHERRVGDTGYVQNPKSMLQSVYRPSLWIARKM